jgi:hypothetical protein
MFPSATRLCVDLTPYASEINLGAGGLTSTNDRLTIDVYIFRTTEWCQSTLPFVFPFMVDDVANNFPLLSQQKNLQGRRGGAQ